MLKKVPQEELVRALRNFRNSRDLDIQKFLNEDAVTFEDRRWCSTYVMLDEEMFASRQELHIEGYFTLSNKVVRLQDGVSNNQRKKLNGGMAKAGNFIHAILIGQLGKYIDEDEKTISSLSANQLLDEAFELIGEVNERIATRVVILECRRSLETDAKEMVEKRQNLHKLYQDYGFKVLQERKDLTQYFKII